MLTGKSHILKKLAVIIFAGLAVLIYHQESRASDKKYLVMLYVNGVDTTSKFFGETI